MSDQVTMAIVISVPRDWLERTCAEMAEELEEEPVTAEEYMGSALAEICGDELPIALWRWPMNAMLTAWTGDPVPDEPERA